jgi:hypothetical protein
MQEPEANPPAAPGDQAPPGTPGTGEISCPKCAGSGTINGAECQNCEGSGWVVQAIGGV